jgi:CHAT domain-containing protein
VLGNLGTVYNGLDNLPKAIESWQKSLDVIQSIGESEREGRSLFRLGYGHSKSHEYQKALDCFEKSVAIFREVGDRRNECLNLLAIGDCYLEQGDYIEALKQFQEALEIALDLQAENIVRRAYYATGNCYSQQEQYLLAKENFSISIGIAEEIRGSLDIEVQRTSYAAGVSSIYQEMVLTLLKLDDYETAYNYMERSRARSFLDMLASGDVKVGKSRHAEFLRQEEEHQNTKGKIEEELLAAADDKTQVATLRGSLEEEWQSISTAIEEKKQFEPELASLVTVNSLTLEEVKGLLDTETTIVEYFLTNEKTIIWLITFDKAEVFQVEIGGDSLKTLVADFRDVITNLGHTDYLSKDLYNILFAPVVNSISTENMLIIPHGILHYLPFQTLQNPDGDYLIDSYKISYLPSASVMKYLEPKRRPKGDRLLALGNPKIDRPGLPALPLAETEVNDIARLYPYHEVLTCEEATESNFRRLAPDYDILHLACHGELNSAYPLFSGLLLAPEADQDGELDVYEIFALDLKAYLVVLSACQTGLGNLTTGDELVGLSRAFIYAGTPSILSSLWMVEDESTAYLMKQFYQNLKKHNKAESLRKAQLVTKKKYPDLQSWASFVLIGDSE